MNKILIENRLPQIIPLLLRDKENPKVLVQSHILSKGRKLITPKEMSHHVSSLANKRHVRITYMEGVETPARTTEPAKASPPVKASSGPANSSLRKKKTTKKGRK